MTNINLELYRKKLIERRDNCKRYLEQARVIYKRELRKHKRIVLYGTIICLIIFIYIKLRESYNFYLAEIIFSQLIIEPLTYLGIIILFFVLRSSYLLFMMTRPNEIRLFRIRIHRGILDEIDRLKNDLAKAELELEEFEKEIKNKEED